MIILEIVAIQSFVIKLYMKLLHALLWYMGKVAISKTFEVNWICAVISNARLTAFILPVKVPLKCYEVQFLTCNKVTRGNRNMEIFFFVTNFLRSCVF